MVAKKRIAASSKKETSAIGFIFDLDCYLFGVGAHYEIYQRLGVHLKTYKGKEGIYFAVQVPHAREVHLVGDFNSWDPEVDPVERISKPGTWGIFNPGMKLGELYEFTITTQSGRILCKADPLAFSTEYHPGTASVTADIQDFSWTDSAWIEKRTQADVQKLSMSIYEAYLGSQRKRDRPEEDGFYTYAEAAHEPVAYVKEMDYTHVELMGIAKHPFDSSWGHQATRYFAPISRYGTPAEFMYSVNYLHRNGIGVVLDWTPAHFLKDTRSLTDFDGEPLFEYADPRKGEHPDWGTKVFDYGKNEVKDFLIDNVLYWVKQYHVDGLKVDAMTSTLYLNYGRQEGQWVLDIRGGNQDLGAIEFFRHPDTVVQGHNHGAFIITGESTTWPKVTEHPEQDRLGSTFKWDMGWMHDFLEYMKLDSYFCKYNHHRMTFGLTYFTSENYVLALPHNEVVRLKCSTINKMPGLDKDKFSSLEAGYTFMVGHPDKKLLFVDQDFGQLHGWGEEVSLDRYFMDENDHKELQNHVKGLLYLYKRYPSLYRQDNDQNDSQWTNVNNDDRSIFGFIRRDEAGKKNLMFIISFTPVERLDYRVGIPKRGGYTLPLDNHGACKVAEAPCFSSSRNECDGQPYSFFCPPPTYGTAIFRFQTCP